MKTPICEEKKCKHFQKGQKNFCQIGYAQNPATEDATYQSIKNNAEVCPRLANLLLYRKDDF